MVHNLYYGLLIDSEESERTEKWKKIRDSHIIEADNDIAAAFIWHMRTVVNKTPNVSVVFNKDNHVTIFNTISEGIILWEGAINRKNLMALEPMKVCAAFNLGFSAQLNQENGEKIYGSLDIIDGSQMTGVPRNEKIFLINEFGARGNQGKDAEHILKDNDHITIYSAVTNGTEIENGFYNPWSKPPVRIESRDLN